MYFAEKLKRRLLFCSSFVFLFGVLIAAHFIPRSNEQTISKFEQERSKRDEGLRFRRLSLEDENGWIDPDGLREARQHVEEMKKIQPQRRKKQDEQIQEAGIAPDSWTWLGPGNIGGRIRSLVIKPNNANDMLAASVSGGIWRTTNAGASWFPVDDFMANLAVSTIIINPTNVNNLYAGTGEGFGNLDAIQGAGIFVSNNGGTSWSQLAATNVPNFNFVNRLAISPNGTRLLAATNSGVWRSTDGGANWTLTLGAGASPQDVDFHPTDNDRVVVGGIGLARFSTDGGATWSSSTFNPAISGRVEVAYAPSNPTIVYAAVNINNGDLYRSNDGGQNYTRVNTGNSFFNSGNGNQGWYDNIVWVNPQDSNFVIVGGIENWRSTDGGTTIAQMSNSSQPNSVHADQHFIVAHPGFNNNTNRTVFFANDGGIYRADNVATVTVSSGWTELNNTLGITQFYGAAGNPDTGVIVGGTQDNGTLKFFGATENWLQAAGADGGYCAADLSDSSYFYGAFQNLGVIRSFNGGDSFAQITSGLGDAGNGQSNFIAPIALDQLNPTKLLAGGWSLWRTDNVRTTANWSAIKAPTGGNSPISAIAFSPGSSNYIVVGHNNGDVYVTFLGSATTPTWTKIDAPTSGLPDRLVTRLVVDQTRSPRWIYATFGGFSSDNVYVSRDQGASWINISGSGATGLPDVPVRTLAIHPHNRNLLYVGTEVGIFTSEDAGATWDISQGAPANVSTDELFWMAGDLIAATHGRGLYRASGGLYVDCNFTGFQLGTFNQPYRTINAAINAVTTRYTPIWVKSCTYNEAINTNKRLEIRSLGTGTIVGQ